MRFCNASREFLHPVCAILYTLTLLPSTGYFVADSWGVPGLKTKNKSERESGKEKGSDCRGQLGLRKVLISLLSTVVPCRVHEQWFFVPMRISLKTLHDFPGSGNIDKKSLHMGVKYPWPPDMSTKMVLDSSIPDIFKRGSKKVIREYFNNQKVQTLIRSIVSLITFVRLQRKPMCWDILQKLHTRTTLFRHCTKTVCYSLSCTSFVSSTISSFSRKMNKQHNFKWKASEKKMFHCWWWG